MAKWIANLDFGRRTICFIQCDLEKHSDWFYGCVKDGRGEEAALAKKDLARRIQDAILASNFEQLFWAGDGGTYAGPEMGGQQVIESARKMLAAFRGWQAETLPRLSVDRLGLRVSCHQCKVFCGPDPAFWASEELNVFLKNERAISHANTISITQQIFEDAGVLANDFRSYRHDAKVKGSDQGTWRIYFDQESALRVRKQTETVIQRFREVLHVENVSEINCESQKFSIGDSVVLHMSPSATDSIHLELLRAPEEEFAKLSAEVPEWKVEEGKVLEEISHVEDIRKKADLIKASPLELQIPLSDFPLARIKYSPIKYSRARSFLTVIREVPNLQKRLSALGVDYAPGMPSRPGILVAHMVVIVSDETHGDCVLLGQRARRLPEKVGFEQGSWSASIEEQFTSDDVLIGQTIHRGLQEELLAEQADNASSSVVALFLEKRFLNLAVAAICKTKLSFRTIVEKQWPNCVDQVEHSQIVALPLRRDLLIECIRTNQFTENARNACRRMNEVIWRQTTTWDLHPTSAFRLALALWATDHL
jgi:hypothetical protein